MAEKRMFSQKITESDAFCTLPFAAQALYLHLNMLADDDGVVDRHSKIMRGLCAAEDDDEWIDQLMQLKAGFQALIDKRFIIPFPSGVVVIKHWKMNNNLRKDRYTPTPYRDEINSLVIKPNGSYTEKDGYEAGTEWLQNGDRMGAEWLQSGDRMVAERGHSIDKISIEERSIEESSTAPDSANCGKNCGKPVENSDTLFLGKHRNVILTHKELAKLKVAFADWDEQIDYLSDFLNATGKNYDNHYDIITGWAGKDGNE